MRYKFEDVILSSGGILLLLSFTVETFFSLVKILAEEKGEMLVPILSLWKVLQTPCMVFQRVAKVA